MQQERIPFHKSPFLQEEIHVILKSLVEDELFSDFYHSEFRKALIQAKQSEDSFIFSSFLSAFSVGLDSLGIKPGDTLLVGEFISEHLCEILRMKNIHIQYCSCHPDTLGILLEDLSEENLQNIQGIYLEYPIAYDGSLKILETFKIPILLNDSSFWGFESLLHRDIARLSQNFKRRFLVCSSLEQEDFIHLGGRGGALHFYSSSVAKPFFYPEFIPTPLSCLIGLLQIQKISIYLENYKAIWQSYKSTFKVKILNLDFSFKTFLLKERDFLILINYFKSNNIELKTLLEKFSINISSKKSNFLKYLLDTTVCLPIYPTLSKQNVEKIIHLLKQVV